MNVFGWIMGYALDERDARERKRLEIAKAYENRPCKLVPVRENVWRVVYAD